MKKGKKVALEKTKENEERDYGLGNSGNDCLMLGKVMNYLGNSSRLGFQKEGDTGT